MLVIGLAGARQFARVLNVSKKALMPVVLTLCFVGSYAVQSNVFDMRVTLVFGIIGYLMLKLEFPVAPMVLGFILGALAENNLRLALVMTGGDASVFFRRPISAVFLALAAVSVLYSLRAVAKEKKHGSEKQQ